MFDLYLLRASGVTQGEIARLMRVTPATVSYWANGKKAVSNKHRARLNLFMSAIGKGVEAGDFPLRGGTTRAERRQLLVAALRKNVTPVTT